MAFDASAFIAAARVDLFDGGQLADSAIPTVKPFHRYSGRARTYNGFVGLSDNEWIEFTAPSSGTMVLDDGVDVSGTAGAVAFDLNGDAERNIPPTDRAIYRITREGSGLFISGGGGGSSAWLPGGTIADNAVITAVAGTKYQSRNRTCTEVTGIADGESIQLTAPASGTFTLTAGATPAGGNYAYDGDDDLVIEAGDPLIYTLERDGSVIKLSGGGGTDISTILYAIQERVGFSGSLAGSSDQMSVFVSQLAAGKALIVGAGEVRLDFGATTAPIELPANSSILLAPGANLKINVAAGRDGNGHTSLFRAPNGNNAIRGLGGNASAKIYVPDQGNPAIPARFFNISPATKFSLENLEIDGGHVVTGWSGSSRVSATHEAALLHQTSGGNAIDIYIRNCLIRQFQYGALKANATTTASYRWVEENNTWEHNVANSGLNSPNGAFEVFRIKGNRYVGIPMGGDNLSLTFSFMDAVNAQYLSIEDVICEGPVYELAHFEEAMRDASIRNVIARIHGSGINIIENEIGDQDEPHARRLALSGIQLTNTSKTTNAQPGNALFGLQISPLYSELLDGIGGEEISVNDVTLDGFNVGYVEGRREEGKQGALNYVSGFRLRNCDVGARMDRPYKTFTPIFDRCDEHYEFGRSGFCSRTEVLLEDFSSPPTIIAPISGVTGIAVTMPGLEISTRTAAGAFAGSGAQYLSICSVDGMKFRLESAFFTLAEADGDREATAYFEDLEWDGSTFTGLNPVWQQGDFPFIGLNIDSDVLRIGITNPGTSFSPVATVILNGAIRFAN